MRLVTIKTILEKAAGEGYAIGAFEFWSIESAQAIVRSAQAFHVPVILQGGEAEALHAGGYDVMRKIAEIAAAEVDIPVALHLDHATDIAQIRRAIDSGFTSVMIDKSGASYEENAETTLKVVEMARPYGIAVESELGTLAGEEGAMKRQSAEASQTDPEQAARFVKDTGIDALAVAIGTAHGFYTFTPEINIPRLKEIRRAVDIPLVLHGGSGTPEDKVREAIENGISKINICTEFIAAFGRRYTQVQAEEGFAYSVKSLFKEGQEAGAALVREKLRLFTGRDAKDC